ncbi:MAG: ogr/Delta-like zinc finger family protein [Proteus vulgaris]
MRQKKVKSRKFDYSGILNMKVMKILCPDCGEKAIIRKTNRKHRQFSDLYCQCTNLECGMTFVLNVTFSHALNPGKKSVENMIDKFIPENKQMALDLLKAPLA